MTARRILPRLSSHRLARKPIGTIALGLLALAWAGSALVGSEPTEAVAPEEQDTAAEARFLARPRQLTFEGRRAGEGYFSPDGKRLVFQSERDPTNPFFQIYELDLATGDTTRVSTGVGKTTCAFYRAGGDEILFSSTHADPASLQWQQEELERRARAETKRYDWDYDPAFEIYLWSRGTGSLTPLTSVAGYDAEASFSPDGKSIVFASTREAYSRELDEAERKRLEIDPAWFSEIYVMDADGGSPRRLTQAPGYDGGPFFTHDGSRIVWRRFEEDGLIADVWTMARDGSDQRQLTDFGAMSWAPYPHPTGRYFIFTSNKHGFGNFELFLVDADGERQPVRVTHTDGFDGLPVFSPDGQRLAWTTNRRGGQGAQLFLAEWNHAAALAALEAAPRRESAPEVE